MKKLTAILMVCVALLSASIAFAQDYTGATDNMFDGVKAGVGGLYISGDDGNGDSQSEFVPTVNLAGLTDMLAYQVFYGFGSDSTVMGGSLDYIVASNFDKCMTCPGSGTWWFGVGPSIVDVSDLYFDDASTTAAVDDTYIGGNLGFGYTWGTWSVDLYAHYLQDQFAFQGMLLYNFNTKK